jgi:hypothetical protein
VGGLRREVEKLKKKGGRGRWDLRCPECGWEITLYGDVPVNLIVLDWELSQDGALAETVDPNLAKLAAHEHDPDAFVDKKSGLPLSDPAVSGIGRGSASLEAKLAKMEEEV